MNPQETKNWIQELEKDFEKNKQAEELEKLRALWAAYEGDDKVISSLQIAEDLKSRPPVEKIATGIKRLDDILGGFVKKQLIVIAAPTKNGKTSFCIELTIRLKEMMPLWIPFEEPAEELIQKFLDRNEAPPEFYTPKKMTGTTLSWIEKKIIEAKIKYDSKIVFIDHLHFVVPFTSERHDLAIGETMRELKRMAKEWDVVIFIISHLKKTRMETQPDLEDLRDSSFTAQEADTVIMLWRKTIREQGKIIISDEVNISIQANRRTGKTGNIRMKFLNGRFYEIDEQHEQQVEDESDFKSWVGVPND